jgi:hypothetical protein
MRRLAQSSLEKSSKETDEMNSKLRLVVIAIALFILAGSNARTAYGAPPTDACSLLSPEQVSSVLGVKVGAGKALMTKACIWPGPPGTKVTLNIIDPQKFAAAKMPVGNGIVKSDVSGIGDDAVYVSAGGIPTTLTVKKGTAAFTIIVSGFSDAQVKAKEKTLALEICSKL